MIRQAHIFIIYRHKLINRISYTPISFEISLIKAAAINNHIHKKACQDKKKKKKKYSPTYPTKKKIHRSR